MRIGYLSADWSFDFTDIEGFPTPGGAGWYRCHLPGEYLAKNGIDTFTSGVIPVVKPSGEIMLLGWDQEVYEDFDVIVVQRWMSEKAAGTIRRARAAGQIVVNDVDDWYGGLSPANTAFQASHPRSKTGMNRKISRKYKVLETEPFSVNHYMESLGASTAITVSTPFLAEKMRPICEQTLILRNAIDLERWPFYEPRETNQPTLGWTGSTRNRSGDLELLRGILEPFCKEYGVKLAHGGHVEGAPSIGSLTGVHESRVINVPSCPARFVPKLYEAFDVGVVPLRDMAFNNAKSAIKLMEMAAAGRPVIASPAPEYLWLHETTEIGAIARKTKQWRHYLEQFLDPQARRLIAEFNRKAVESLDFKTCWVNWAEAYSSIHD